MSKRKKRNSDLPNEALKAGGAVAAGAAAGVATSATIGGMGLTVGGTAVAIGAAPVVAAGAVVGLAGYSPPSNRVFPFLQTGPIWIISARSFAPIPVA